MFVIAEKYHVISSLGGGGMGAVYEALHSGTGRRVAVKMLRQEIASNPRSRERFVREARMAGSLASAHVAEVLDAGTDEVSGLPFIVMELLEGPNLRDYLHERGPLPVGLVLVIAAHVANGLKEAHAAGVIHRDIKPANVVLCSSHAGDLVAKIVDFGVAKAEGDEEQGLTRTGDVVGSLRYMSPEQLSGEGITSSSDLWSLGAVMYEALAGVSPAGTGDGVGTIVRRVCIDGIDSLATVAPSVAPSISALVGRALERDPSRRVASAGAMLEEIVRFLPNGIRVPATVLDDPSSIVVAYPRAPAERSKLWPLALGIGASAIVATALLAQARPRPAAPQTTHAPSSESVIELPPDEPSVEPSARPIVVAAPAASSAVRAPKAPLRAPPSKPRNPLDHM